MTNTKGYRGYIGSRPYQGQRTPQHVQNLVIRDFCQRNAFLYLLSATEYNMPGCYMMLEEVMSELPSLDGIVLYSLFMLPNNRDRRQGLVRRVLECGATLHSALENFSITNEEDYQRVENILGISRIAHQTEFIL